MIHLILKELPIDDGLFPSDILGMIGQMPEKTELFPLDIEDETGQNHAVGFITHEAYDAIDYDIRRIYEPVKTELFDKDSTCSDRIVTEIEGYETLLYR